MAEISSPVAVISPARTELLYCIDDVPPWYLTILLGLQHFLTMLGTTVAIPFILCPALCIGPDDPARVYIISTILFVSGIVTIFQTTFGIRLPILQGGTVSLLIPTFAILNLPQWQCPKDMALNDTLYTRQERDIAWKSRICEVQGAILIAGVFEVFLGATGIIGFLLRFITPLVIAPIIALVGLGLVENAVNLMGDNWIVALSTAVLIVIFSVYLKSITAPFPLCKGSKCKMTRLPIFRLFPVLFSLIIMWIVCYIFTRTNILKSESRARTDLHLNILKVSPWFRFPYPFQWGFPTFSLSAGLGMFGGILASVLASVGDYYACANLSGVSAPPVHAINRGICVEGLGTIIAGIFGTGTGTTSYSENIGVLGITKVASRRVLQAAALMLIIVSVVSKFGAVFSIIPTPIVAGIFLITFAVITATGLSQIQYINLNSTRNLIVLGIPLFCGLVIPRWLQKHQDSIKTGILQVDNVLEVLLSTHMFVGGLLAIILDNTISRSGEHLGFTNWTIKSCSASVDLSAYPSTTYNFYFAMNLLMKLTWTKYIPICPTFDPKKCSCRDNESHPTSRVNVDTIEM